MGEQFHRSVERAFENAIYSSDLILTGRKLREFPPIDDETRRDLSDTINADLSRNLFIEFPSILSTFRSLERLNLYHNAMKTIPEEICQLQQLKHLDLSRNQLTNLPSIVCQLKNLEILHLNNNKIEKLPDEIGQFERLIELDLSQNEIEQIPNSIGSIKSLRTFEIRRNFLIELPEDFCLLKLIRFDCSSNRLKKLPLNLRHMNTLIELHIENNPLENPPTSICTLGLLHVMKFLHSQAMKEEKQRGFLTEFELNAKYRNSFSFQGKRSNSQLDKTFLSSDSGYLTTESNEKNLGDDDSVHSMSNEQSFPCLTLSLADEFSKELARQRENYQRKKSQAQQLKEHFLRQLSENDDHQKLSSRRSHHQPRSMSMGPSQSRRSFQRSNPLINGRDFHLTDGHCRSEENEIPPRSLKEKSQNENEIRQILETKLKIHLPRDLNEALNDGVVLCHFINQLHPHSIPSIHVPSPSVPKLSSAKSRRNWDNFLLASRQNGVAEVERYSQLIDFHRLKRHLNSLIADSHQHSQSYEQTDV